MQKLPVAVSPPVNDRWSIYVMGKFAQSPMGWTKFAYVVVAAAASSVLWAGDTVCGRLESVGIALTVGMRCGNGDL